MYKSQTRKEKKGNTKGKEPGKRFDPPNRPLVILVVGETGAGKSTFINKVLGADQRPVSNGFDLCTDEVASVDISGILNLVSRRGLRRVLLVDTPGFNNTSQDDAAIVQKIKDWLRVENYLPGGVIYLHDISPDNQLNTATKTLKTLRLLLGDAIPQFLPKVILGATKADGLTAEQVGDRLEQLKFEWKDMISNGASVGTTEGNHKLVWDLVKDIHIRVHAKGQKPQSTSAFLKTQQEMVENRMGVKKEFDPKCPIVILVVGISGVGKSTFINEVLGYEKMAVSHCLEKGTFKTSGVDISDHLGPSYKCRVLLVDTPPLETGISGLEALLDLAQWLSVLRPNYTLGGIICLQSAISRDYSMVTQNLMNVLTSICGRGAAQKVVLGITGMDEVRLWSVERGQEVLLKVRHWRDVFGEGVPAVNLERNRDSSLDFVRGVLERFFLDEAIEETVDPEHSTSVQTWIEWLKAKISGLQTLLHPR